MKESEGKQQTRETMLMGMAVAAAAAAAPKQTQSGTASKCTQWCGQLKT